MAKKVYAVRKGNTEGIFYTWDECKSSIDGYSGADYKGFATESEAKAYLSNEVLSKDVDTHGLGFVDKDGIIAYVDGSYSHDLQRYAFGCVILTPKGEKIKESGYGDDVEGIAIRNVAGELLGAIHATKWAITNAFTSIEIIYDYEGISKWITGEWKAKNKSTQNYVEEMGRLKHSINVTFTKVVAHSNNVLNDEADRLAKEALKTGKKARLTKGDFWFTAEGIEYSDISIVADLIKEETGAQCCIRDIPYGTSIELTNEKEKVIINHYTNRKVISVQGKPKALFSLIITYVTELVDVESIPEIFNTSFNMTVDKEKVKTTFKCYLPYSWDKLPEKMSRVLHQAVYNLNLQGEVFEASFLVQPAFRVLEGHLKQILVNNKIVESVASIKTNGFYMFEKRGFKYRLKSDMIGVASVDIVSYIGSCYTYYNMNRNALSHWDDPLAPKDTTTIISDTNTAHGKIRDILEIIDGYYKLLG